MEKLYYLVFEADDVPGSKIRQRLIDEAVPTIRETGGRGIIVNVQDEEVAAGTPVQKRSPGMRAAVSFWLENADDRGAAEAALAGCASGIAGYLVAESRPLIHQTRPGERSDGMKQVCCVAKKPGLSDQEFYDIWTHDHKIVAVETQSTVGYVRNVIVRPLTEGAPDCWTGIVEETFPIGALTDPLVFYDSKDQAEFEQRLERMMASVRRFLDDAPMEFTHMSEYDLG